MSIQNDIRTSQNELLSTLLGDALSALSPACFKEVRLQQVIFDGGVSSNQGAFEASRRDAVSGRGRGSGARRSSITVHGISQKCIQQ